MSAEPALALESQQLNVNAPTGFAATGRASPDRGNSRLYPPKSRETTQLWQLLKRFKREHGRVDAELQLPAATAYMRACAHEYARVLGLDHSSTGEGADRAVLIRVLVDGRGTTPRKRAREGSKSRSGSRSRSSSPGRQESQQRRRPTDRTPRPADADGCHTSASAASRMEPAEAVGSGAAGSGALARRVGANAAKVARSSGPAPGTKQKPNKKQFVKEVRQGD